MPFITHFKNPNGEKLPIAAATQYTVAIPAAGSTDLKGWWLERNTYMRRILLEGVTEEMAVHVSCHVDAIFTEHGLRVAQDAGTEALTIELELSSLPATATSVYLLSQPAVGGGAVYMPVVGQGGDTTELERSVGQIKTDLREVQDDIDEIDSRVKELENGGSGGGGGSGDGASVQSDYLQNDSSEPDYIKNRPFYEERGTKNGRITWDGTLGDRTHEIIVDRVLVRVSDKTNKNIKQYSCTMRTADGNIVDFTEQDVEAVNENCDAFLVDGLPVVLCARKPTKVVFSGETLTIREAGTYFMLKGADYVERLDYTLPNYSHVKKIDAHKFLDFGDFSMELLFDVMATLELYALNRAYCNVKQALNLEVGETYTVEFDGVSYVCVAKASADDGAPYIGNLYELDQNQPNTGEPFLLAAFATETGIYSEAPGDHTVTVYKGGKTKHVQIPSECLVLTSPNGTKYRLTVSDDGTLSAVIAE